MSISFAHAPSARSGQGPWGMCSYSMVELDTCIRQATCLALVDMSAWGSP